MTDSFAAAHMSQFGPKRTFLVPQCPLLGVKRTSNGRASMSAFDLKRTLPTHRRSPDNWQRTTGCFHPCFAIRLGGVPGGKARSVGWS
jgi:hypothetical protein